MKLLTPLLTALENWVRGIVRDELNHQARAVGHQVRQKIERLSEITPPARNPDTPELASNHL